MTLMTAILIAAMCLPAGLGHDHDDGWDLLFDGPRLGEKCVVGALSRGMRFYDPRDREREWIVINWPIPIRERTAEEKAAGENWPIPEGQMCVDLATGNPLLWPWNKEVVRIR